MSLFPEKGEFEIKRWHLLGGFIFLVNRCKFYLFKNNCEHYVAPYMTLIGGHGLSNCLVNLEEQVDRFLPQGGSIAPRCELESNIEVLCCHLVVENGRAAPLKLNNMIFNQHQKLDSNKNHSLKLQSFY